MKIIYKYLFDNIYSMPISSLNYFFAYKLFVKHAVRPGNFG